MPFPNQDSSVPTDSAGRQHADSGLRTLVERRLRSCGYLALRDVRCTADEGVLWLTGRLPSHYLRQVAHAVVAEIEGPRAIINLIEVEAEVRSRDERAGGARARWVSGGTPRGPARVGDHRGESANCCAT
jgi:osmotically-inducible protein OsmY